MDGKTWFYSNDSLDVTLWTVSCVCRSMRQDVPCVVMVQNSAHDHFVQLTLIHTVNYCSNQHFTGHNVTFCEFPLLVNGWFISRSRPCDVALSPVPLPFIVQHDRTQLWYDVVCVFRCSSRNSPKWDNETPIWRHSPPSALGKNARWTHRELRPQASRYKHLEMSVLNRSLRYESKLYYSVSTDPPKYCILRLVDIWDNHNIFRILLSI